MIAAVDDNVEKILAKQIDERLQIARKELEDEIQSIDDAAREAKANNQSMKKNYWHKLNSLRLKVRALERMQQQ